MSMSRKNYEAIAKVLNEDYGYLTPTKVVAEKLAKYFKEDNPNFDYDRFMAACLKDN